MWCSYQCVWNIGQLSYQWLAITRFKYNDWIMERSQTSKFCTHNLCSLWVISILFGINSTRTYYSSSQHSKSLAVFAENLKAQLDPIFQYRMNLCMERGASNWLSALPLKYYSFQLHKSAFHDAIHLRYGWVISDISSTCTCRQSFSVEHALSCPRGGFPLVVTMKYMSSLPL